MIERYTLSPFNTIWDPSHLPAHWRLVAATQVRARSGDEQFRRLLNSEIPTWADVKRYEQVTRHDVVAFLDLWRENLPRDLAKLVHLGLTSSDLVDTTNALHMIESSVVIEFALDRLIRTLAEKSIEYFDVPRLGRTHGQPAEVTRLGYQLARYVGQLLSSHDRFRTAREDVGLVKMSGAVGGFRWTTPEQEVALARFMGYEYAAAEMSGQRIPRDGYARWVSELAIIATVVEDAVLQVRLGQQYEIGELFEAMPEGAVGSSAMPHKGNPIQSETLTGLARLVRSQILPIMEGIPTWSERDITHSSVERDALQKASTLVYYMLVNADRLFKYLRIDAARMLVNINAAGDRVRSSHLLVEVTDRIGDAREARELIASLFRSGPNVIDRLYEEVPGLKETMRPEPSMDIDHIRRLMREVLNVDRGHV